VIGGRRLSSVLGEIVSNQSDLASISPSGRSSDLSPELTISSNHLTTHH
jgi:hypothetical protein